MEKLVKPNKTDRNRFNYKQTTQINKLTSDLIELIKRKKVVLYLGAGISFNSGIPVVNKFIPYILKKLGVSDRRDIELLLNSSLPFESFMEVLQKKITRDLVKQLASYRLLF